LSVSSLFAAQIARYYRLKKKTNSLKIALNKKRAKFKQALNAQGVPIFILRSPGAILSVCGYTRTIKLTPAGFKILGRNGH
jgi:hypothetical protein